MYTHIYMCNLFLYKSDMRESSLKENYLIVYFHLKEGSSYISE